MAKATSSKCGTPLSSYLEEQNKNGFVVALHPLYDALLPGRLLIPTVDSNILTICSTIHPITIAVSKQKRWIITGHDCFIHAKEDLDSGNNMMIVKIEELRNLTEQECLTRVLIDCQCCVCPFIKKRPAYWADVLMRANTYSELPRAPLGIETLSALCDRFDVRQSVINSIKSLNEEDRMNLVCGEYKARGIRKRKANVQGDEASISNMETFEATSKGPDEKVAEKQNIPQMTDAGRATDTSPKSAPTMPQESNQETLF